MSEKVIYNIYDDWFYKEEKIDGKIYRMARPSDKHESIQSSLIFLFSDYFRGNKKNCRAKYEAQLDIDSGDNYVVPDVMVFCYEQSKDVPLIVIEVLSKSTLKRDLGVKMEKYAKLGIKEYWVIDCDKYAIDVYLLNGNKKYEKYDTYVYYTDNDFSEIPKIREKEKAEVEIIEEFSPVSIPEMKIRLEDVFYFIEEEDFDE